MSDILFLSDCTSKVTFKFDISDYGFSSRIDYELQNYIEAFQRNDLNSIVIFVSPLFWTNLTDYKSFFHEFFISLDAFLANNAIPVLINKISISRHLVTSCSNSNDLDFESFCLNKLSLFSATYNHFSVVNFSNKHDLDYRNYFIFRQPFMRNDLNFLNDAYSHSLQIYFSSPLKVVFTDADNTLWGGILGEDGCSNLVIGREYPGIMFSLYQQWLLELKKLGVLLVLVTKNNDDNIRECFSNLSMPLSLDDFVLIYSNWDRKSKNISDALQVLNVDQSSAVFFDDSDYELTDVASNFSQLECIKFSIHNVLVHKQNPRFYLPYVTSEDRSKTQMYQAEFQRSASKNNYSSLIEYVSSLGVILSVSVNDTKFSARAAQLCNKTNQFNMTTKRYSESDVINFMNNNSVFIFSASDRFGDLGVVGLSIVIDDKIDTFLLSCRALGRFIEDNMLNYILSFSESKLPIEGCYIRSSKNSQCETFYRKYASDIIHTDTGTIYKFVSPIVPRVEINFFIIYMSIDKLIDTSLNELLDTVFPFDKPEISEDSDLLELLDSIVLVELIMITEQQIYDLLSVHVSVADENTFDWSSSPFRSVSLWRSHIQSLVDNLNG